MEQKELTRDEQLELEQQAIEALLQYGVKFTVPLKIEPKEPPVWIRTWNRYFPKHVKVWRDKRIPKKWNVEKTTVVDINENTTKDIYVRVFHIKPLMLGTTDMIRKLAIEMEYSEQSLQENPIPESERLMKFIPTMAKMAAVAVLNKSEIADVNNKEVLKLQKFFLSHLTSARLQKLCIAIGKMSDKAGFLNSTRLILQVGTTQPKASRVE